MKRNLFFIVVILITAASCVKDRIPAKPAPVVVPAGDTLMYYWSFNNGDSAKRHPDFPASAPGAFFNYYASYIDYTGGSRLNLVGTVDSGQCLRVRNPSTALIFTMPTTGYDSVVLTFAEEASSTSSGSTLNTISYTTDGINYVSTALANNQYTIGITFGLQSFDFSSDPKVNNNPLFAVKIVFSNNNTGMSGNDRFDNVTLMGVRKQ